MILPPNRRLRGRAALPPPGAASIFAALGDETRLRIVARLCNDGPLSIARLSEGAPISRQAITKHLQALSAAGLVISRRAGREHLWALECNRLGEARRYLDAISAHWDDALVRLRAYVEDDVA
jgi:DNA-binding transcriptional ArsR family regulator